MARQPKRRKQTRKAAAPARPKVPRRTRAPREDEGDRAPFVFRGTVVQRGAATLDQVPLTRDTLIVHVDEILEAPDVLRGFEGRDITVQLGQGQRVTTGTAYVFHARGWLYGDGLAVQCVRLAPGTDADVSRTRRALASASDAALKARAERAELVVTGQVTEVRDVPRPPGAPITEHDPGWREAVIAVESVERGGPRAGRKPRQVTIRFAASPDVRWAKAPKFKVGQAGVWLLGDKQAGAAIRAAAGAPKHEFVVVDPEDFYPADASAQVKALLSK